MGLHENKSFLSLDSFSSPNEYLEEGHLDAKRSNPSPKTAQNDVKWLAFYANGGARKKTH
jgi:hypothetical protein